MGFHIRGIMINLHAVSGGHKAHLWGYKKLLKLQQQMDHFVPELTN